jgi:hypothetical protein
MPKNACALGTDSSYLARERLAPYFIETPATLHAQTWRATDWDFRNLRPALGPGRADSIEY